MKGGIGKTNERANGEEPKKSPSQNQWTDMVENTCRKRKTVLAPALNGRGTKVAVICAGVS